MIARLLAKYQSIGLISSSLLVGAILSFIALPFLTRLYSVQDFGQYGIALAIVSILSTVANLRLDQALLVAETQHYRKLIFESAVFSVGFMLIMTVILNFWLDREMLLAVCSGVLANTLIQSLYNYKFALHAEQFCAAVNILRSAIVIIVQLSLPMLIKISLLGSYAVSSLILIVAVLSYILKHQLYMVSWQVYKNYKDFIFSNTPHALLNSFSHNLPYYVVGHVMGAQAMGFYAIVERTLRVPINLISQTLRQFFIRQFKHSASNQQALKVSILLSILSLPLFAIFFVIPEQFYLWIFGSEWVGISSYFHILVLGYWAIFCNPPSSAYLIAQRNSQVLFKLQMIELLVKCGLFAGLYRYFDARIEVLWAVPIALIVYNFAILYFVWRTKK